jgi:hypothetical protein
MTFLYPFIKRSSLLVLFFAVAVQASAQEKSYAVNSTNNNNPPQVSDPGSGIIQPFIKIRGRAERKVALAWPSFSQDVSHYVIERSTDGRRFQEVGLLFTVGAEEPRFDFTDKFRANYTGPLYYRLRVEFLDGNAVYTPVTIMKAIVNSEKYP